MQKSANSSNLVVSRPPPPPKQQLCRKNSTVQLERVKKTYGSTTEDQENSSWYVSLDEMVSASLPVPEPYSPPLRDLTCTTR